MKKERSYMSITSTDEEELFEGITEEEINEKK